ncbi:MAG: prolyl oligopeptidase family serine peptidase [Planctomycetota bacterium]
MRIRIALTLGLSALLVGCASFTLEPAADRDTPGAVAVAAPIPASTWPDRLGGRGAGVIRDLDTKGLIPGRLRRGRYLEPGESDLADARALIAAEAPGQRLTFTFEGPGSLIYTPSIDPKRPSDPSYFVYTSAAPAKEGAALIQRTWFGYSPAEEPKGLLLIVPGMLGTPAGLIDGFTTALMARGWSILRMMAHPSRFTEHIEFRVDPESDQDAAFLASVLTDRAAEAAYAATDAIRHAATLDPRLDGLPVAAFGISGGAMILPTILARQPELYDAAVISAGGANFFQVNHDSSYARWIGAFSVEFPSGATREDELEFSRRYLRAAPLDSYHTARTLTDLRILMIHGSKDEAVPAYLGDLLWERLGKPERMVSNVGHELLFLSLPLRFVRVMDWLDETLNGGAR